MRRALIVIAQDGYQDREFAGTRDGLTGGNFEVVIASKEEGPCQGKLGSEATAIVALRDVRVEDFDRIAFIGGPGAAALASDPDALRIARETVMAKKPLGAICIAPTILAAAGVLRGKRATVWNGDGKQAAELERVGATYTGDGVMVDGLIVTASGPPVAEEFGRTLSALSNT